MQRHCSVKKEKEEVRRVITPLIYHVRRLSYYSSCFSSDWNFFNWFLLIENRSYFNSCVC